MESKSILITGPAGSGKTHIAMAIMQLLPDAAVKTNSKDLKEIATFSIHEELKIVVIEQITTIKEMEVIALHFRDTNSNAALVFTSQVVTEAPEGFTVINCNYKF